MNAVLDQGADAFGFTVAHAALRRARAVHERAVGAGDGRGRRRSTRSRPGELAIAAADLPYLPRGSAGAVLPERGSGQRVEDGLLACAVEPQAAGGPYAPAGSPRPAARPTCRPRSARPVGSEPGGEHLAASPSCIPAASPVGREPDRQLGPRLDPGRLDDVGGRPDQLGSAPGDATPAASSEPIVACPGALTVLYVPRSARPRRLRAASRRGRDRRRTASGRSTGPGASTRPPSESRRSHHGNRPVTSYGPRISPALARIALRLAERLEHGQLSAALGAA